MSKGLTLIETIISIAIITIGALFVIAVFPLGIRVTELNEKNNIALFLASERIENAIYQGYSNLEEGVYVEDYGEIPDFSSHKRELYVDCFDPNENYCTEETGIKKIKVIVYPKSLIEKRVELISLITKK